MERDPDRQRSHINSDIETILRPLIGAIPKGMRARIVLTDGMGESSPYQSLEQVRQLYRKYGSLELEYHASSS